MAPRDSYDVLLFDLGGVIVELTGLPVWQRWRGGGESDEESWEQWLRSPAVRAFESGQSSTAEFGRDIVREFELPVDAETFLAEFERWPRGPYPGALELLTELGERYRLACLSNCNELHWPRFTGEMGLRRVFDRLFASHELGVLKPDREVFERVAAALAAEPERIFFLDDNRLNVEGARAAGLRARRVQGPEAARATLCELGVL